MSSYLAGLDIGSAFAKAVILKDHALFSYSICPTEGRFNDAAEKVLEEALEEGKITYDDVGLIGGTGIGASFIPRPFTKITDISCHCRGIHYFFPSVRTLIETGNQTSKVIKVSLKGKVADCLISEKCAAGSGRVLQVIAKVLGVNLEDLGPLSLDSTHPAKFTTGCAVFLETEAISRVAEGTPKVDIAAGLHRTLASKICTMAQRMNPKPDFAFTGGGARDRGLVKVMEEILGQRLLVPNEPLITGALGAALIVSERNI